MHWLTVCPSGCPRLSAGGSPDSGYPHPWLVYRWLPGTSLDRTALTPALVADVASFVLALEEIPTEGGPPPGAAVVRWPRTMRQWSGRLARLVR